MQNSKGERTSVTYADKHFFGLERFSRKLWGQRLDTPALPNVLAGYVAAPRQRLIRR